MSEASLSADSTQCRNCGAALAIPNPKYCAACGQETARHPPTVWEFAHEFITHYVALEGRLWHTLGLLFFRPGMLTERYLAGQKRRYVNPLRLYLTASILFFIVVKLFGVWSLVHIKMSDEARFENAQASAADVKKLIEQGAPKPDDKKYVEGFDSRVVLSDIKPENQKSVTLDNPVVDIIKCEGSSACTKIRTFVAERYKDKTIKEFGHLVKDRALSLAPYVMFLFLPVFAMLTYFLYRRRRMYYGEHIVYALHVQAFIFFLLLTSSFANKTVGIALLVWGMGYLWLAMRRVFGGRWWAITLRYMVIVTLYPLMLLIVVMLTMAAAIFI